MRYGSVCSGIEAATVAWHPLGWKPSFFSEIEAFPRAVLKHHYPDTPLHGDFTTIQGTEYEPIDLLVGGTPCQSFSVAGLRGGLDDDRGNLALEFLRLADRTRPRWLVWENVPGVLSSNEGRDFGSILGGMGELGYGWAYRVLDAQYFGVAQRRRRVFVVGYLGDWRPAAAVLFERHSLQGHPPPSRKARQDIAGSLTGSPSTSRSPNEDATLISTQKALSHWDGPEHPHPTLNQSHNTGGVGQSNQEIFSQRGAYLAPDVSCTLNAGAMGRQDYETETFISFDGDIARTLSARHDGSPCADRGPDVVAVAFDLAQITSKTNRSRAEDGLPASTLSKESQMHVAVAPTIKRDYGKGYGDGEMSAGGLVPVAFHAEAQADQLPTAGRDTSISDSLTTSQHAAVAFQSSQSGVRTGEVHATLDSNNGSRRHNGVIAPVAFDAYNQKTDNVTHTLRRGSGPSGDAIPQTLSGNAVRRLTPRECERLQGFPDDYTLILNRGKPAADGPRYKALGNSMAVPVMRWIGERIQMVDELIYAGHGTVRATIRLLVDKGKSGCLG